jgi:hypothetical protein
VSPDAGSADAVERALHAVQRAIFRYPVATKAAFRALVAEGRRYAGTPEGAALHARLQGSPAVAKARLLWDVLSVRAFAEDGDALPEFFVDRLAQALRAEHLEPLLARALERWMGP